MNKNYNLLASTIKSRLNPDGLYESIDDTRIFNKALRGDTIGSISYDDVDEFVHQAMKSVGKDYTDVTLQAGSMVKQHLQGGLSNVEYRYQGSVMTNTHIRGYSDIDLICISTRFYSYASGQVQEYLSDQTLRSQLSENSIKKLIQETNVSQYTGDSINDLRLIRIQSESILASKYSICNTDHPKAIKIKNQNLKREVDIVTAAWHDDISSIIRDKGENRGVALFNKATNSQEQPDYPFTCIQLLNQRGTNTDQRLKKMIRFLKNLRSFSDQNIDLSSFVINSLCYNIAVNKYEMSTETELVAVLYKELGLISNSRDYANTIVSVDGREWIYKYNTKNWIETQKLYKEIAQIATDLFKTIAL